MSRTLPVSLLCLCASMVSAQAPLSTVFTYQGELGSGSGLATGLHDFRFRLYDAAVGGAQVGPLLCSDNVSLANGRFTVDLDFGAVFAGLQRFLEIDVRADTGLSCVNTAGFVILGPRQPLTAAPNALFALNSTTAANATQLNGQGPSFYQNAANLSSGTIPSARLSGAYSGALTLSNAGNAFTGGGAGLTGVNADLLDGLNATAFLQSVPSPLTLSGTSATHIIRGENASATVGSVGVFGSATATTGSTVGGRFENSSTDGRGVFGLATAGTGGTNGGEFWSASTGGRGVVGLAHAASGATYGAWGQSDSTGGRGVYGVATAATGGTYGVYGQSASTSGRAVFGHSSALTGTAEGVFGLSDSSSGRGAVGWASALSGAADGVFGLSESSGGRGTVGWATATSGTTYGVFGLAQSPSGSGVFGWASAAVGSAYGVFGQSNSASGTGVFGDATTGPTSFGVTGRGPNFGVYAIGGMGASGFKNFRIDHPDDPENKYLLHYCAESPEAINFYRDTVTLDGVGEAVVELPHYFAKINKSPSYQLTAVGAPMPLLHIAEKISIQALESGATMEPGEAAPLCTFRIAGGAPGGEVSWRVEAVRNDRWAQKRGAPVEVEKQGREKGTYQHPDLYGQPPEKGMNYDATRRHAEPALPEPIAARGATRPTTLPRTTPGIAPRPRP